MTPFTRAALAHEFQLAAFAQLEDKLTRALSPKPRRGWTLAGEDNVSPIEIRGVVCSGGVASNQFLRTRLQAALNEAGRPDVSLYFPPVSLCVDNAAMIAWAGHLYWDERRTDFAPHVMARWPLD